MYTTKVLQMILAAVIQGKPHLAATPSRSGGVGAYRCNRVAEHGVVDSVVRGADLYLGVRNLLGVEEVRCWRRGWRLILRSRSTRS